MMKNPSLVSLMLATCLAVNAASAQSRSASGSVVDPTIAAIATDVYIFGYPLVSMYVTKRVATNAASPMNNAHAPINQVGNLFAYPPATDRDVVAINFNTLYSSAFLDLSKEPIVVHMPNTQGRYYVMEILDFWTNVIGDPGKRTTGTGMQDIAIAGPDWKGTMPAGITTTVRSPTNNAWILNRIQANGPKDYAVVNALQRQISTTPLSSFGKPHTWPPGTVDPGIDMKKSPKSQVDNMSGEQFFTAMAQAMKNNRPGPQDAPMVAKMARIGLKPGSDFQPDPALRGEIDAGAKAALEKIGKSAPSLSRNENGWMIPSGCGKYGTQYALRAVVALLGLGCNLMEDAFYPVAEVDAEGKPLTGTNRYVVHFPAGQEPPVKAFWSVTMYDKEFFQVENPINRNAVSSWMDLKKNSDGSTDIYVQHASPGADKQANWLPAPAGGFVLMLRLYWPEQQAQNGAWKPPGVKKVN